MSIVDDDDDDDDESSSDDDVAPSQNENEDYGGGGGDDAFSQHSPTSPDTQNMPDAYPDLELLAVSHAEEEDEDADEADGGHSSDSGSRRSPCPPDYDVELYGSVSSESEDEVKGLAKDPGKLGRGATIYPAAETHEAQGSHLIVTLNERKNEAEKNKAEKNKAEKKEKEKEVVNCPNWPHLPFVSLSLSIPFLFLALTPPIYLPTNKAPSAVPTPTLPATAPTPPTRTNATATFLTSQSPQVQTLYGRVDTQEARRGRKRMRLFSRRRLVGRKRGGSLRVIVAGVRRG